MQKLFLLFAAVIVIALPAVASADTITFQAPATAPNVGSGGSRQFDLDHHSAYTWKIGGVNLAGKTITSATISGGRGSMGASFRRETIVVTIASPVVL